MGEVINSPAETLRGLTQRLGQLQPGDDNALAQIGADLETAASDLPGEMQALRGLLELCLESLQAVYLKTVSLPQGLVEAVAAAVAAVEYSLHTCHPSDPRMIVAEPGHALWALLDRDVSESPYLGAVARSSEPAAEPGPGPEPRSSTAARSPEDDGESDLDGIVNEFLVESYENLDQLDQDLLTLEQNPSDKETLSSIFRTVHTIKGTCGFLGFSRLESLTHAGENLLSLLRDGELSLSPEVTSTLLLLVDAVRSILSNIEAHRQEGETDYSALIESLTRLQQVEAASLEAIARPEALESDSSEPRPARFGDILIEAGRVDPAHIAEAAEYQRKGDPRHLGEILVDKGIIKPEDVVDALRIQEESRSPGLSDSSVRIDVGLLDKLMNLVGELVLARNQVLQYAATLEGAAFVGTAQHLNLITTELQEVVMKTRMQPIGNVWSKFPRVARDLAKACGKQIHLEMEGQETEVDRTIIEAIKDPLMHIVRNSVDHGMEAPEVRARNGKLAEGRLFLRAYHEGGKVNIEVSDDGAGIDPERIKQKALQTGLITPEQAGRMSDREAINLVFLPGLSTAQKVTNVSGRGVGMDVVRTNIQKIGGTVDIQSQLGEGSTLKIKLPLTLAIIPALIVTSGGDRYAIPQVSLVELVRLEGQQAGQAIEMIHGAPVYRLRGKLLPVLYLSRELRTAESDLAGGAAVAVGDGGPEVDHMVVLQSDGRQFGLVVDKIHDTEEIVVKPLGNPLKGLSAFAGATIMGDGKVALILDVLGIAQRAHVVSEIRGRSIADVAARHTIRPADFQTLLLVAIGAEGRFAIPLSSVARLEEFPASSVEWTQNREAVQYRGHILPLIHLSRVLGLEHGGSELPLGADPTGSPELPDPLHVVVYSDQRHRVGLVVDRILDIVEESVTAPPAEDSSLIHGAVVIQGRITDLLNAPAIARAADTSGTGDTVTRQRG
jgi:two-component system chemotaxis sensor kinase CheA